MKTLRRLGLALAVLLGSCVATPLPTPPSADPQRMTLVESPTLPGGVDLRGGPGAIVGDLLSLRVTSARAWAEAPVAADGSFEVRELPAAPIDVLFLEAIVADDDLFLVALRSDGAGGVDVTDAGGDRDSDGSPDRVDCAPDDASLGGRRCPLTCVTEICGNGLDDDCDGAIDEDCVDGDGDGFAPPSDCDDTNGAIFPGATEVCGDGADGDCDGLVDDGCPIPCRTDAECAAGRLCVSGICECPPAAPDECGGACVDTASDALHCGACDAPCAGGQRCVASTCTP